METTVQKRKKQLSGTVVSNKMEKTVVVAVTRYAKHPKYQKYQKITKRYKAHDEFGTDMGEKVIIEECVPLSKDKHFKVIKV
jgi:small subunit ribosomal protein S17